MLKRLAVLASAIVALGAAPACATYSVVAYDPDSGELGVAVQSRTPWSGHGWKSTTFAAQFTFCRRLPPWIAATPSCNAQMAQWFNKQHT